MCVCVFCVSLFHITLHYQYGIKWSNNCLFIMHHMIILHRTWLVTPAEHSSQYERDHSGIASFGGRKEHQIVKALAILERNLHTHNQESQDRWHSLPWKSKKDREMVQSLGLTAMYNGVAATTESKWAIKNPPICYKPEKKTSVYRICEFWEVYEQQWNAFPVGIPQPWSIAQCKENSDY